MLMKPLNPAEATAKYVTLRSCLRDIRVTAHLMPEMMSEFSRTGSFAPRCMLMNRCMA